MSEKIVGRKQVYKRPTLLNQILDMPEHPSSRTLVSQRGTARNSLASSFGGMSLASQASHRNNSKAWNFLRRVQVGLINSVKFQRDHGTFFLYQEQCIEKVYD